MRLMVTRITGPSANVSVFPGDSWLDGWMDGRDSRLAHSGKAALSRYATASVRWQTSVCARLRKHTHTHTHHQSAHTDGDTLHYMHTERARVRVCVRYDLSL